MKSIYKYFAHAGLTAAMCIALALPTMAQRGGGGGHSGGGGGGGGHFGGGGFSGGTHVSSGSSGARSSGSFSGARSSGSFSGGRSGAVVSRGGNYAGRPGVGARAGAVVPRGYVRSVTAGGGHAFANRGAVASGGVYGHSYAGGGAYARPYGWRSHGGFFYSHGYYGMYYYPWLGFSCAFLPWGYYPFWWGDYNYYYSDGLFYTYDNSEYTVVEPPVGAEVDKLPTKAQSIVIDGQQYYEYNGVYYQAITKDNGQVAYQVAGKDGVLNTGGETGAGAVTPKVGDITYTLPEGCKKVNLNGTTLYVSDDGIYYQETTDNSGKKAYKITAIESSDQ
jgi:hypothetical protein